MNEGWEASIYLTYAVSFVLIGVALGMAPETNIQTWARAEAQARLDMDEKPEFGVHYNNAERALEFQGDKKDNPFNEEEEEDDEEEEEEEEGDDEDDDDDE